MNGIPNGLRRPSSLYYNMMVLPASFQSVISHKVLLLFCSEGWLCLFFYIISNIVLVIFKEFSAIAFICKFCLLFLLIIMYICILYWISLVMHLDNYYL